jgi:hypothetical protein
VRPALSTILHTLVQDDVCLNVSCVQMLVLRKWSTEWIILKGRYWLFLQILSKVTQVVRTEFVSCSQRYGTWLHSSRDANELFVIRTVNPFCSENMNSSIIPPPGALLFSLLLRCRGLSLPSVRLAGTRSHKVCVYMVAVKLFSAEKGNNSCLF